MNTKIQLYYLHWRSPTAKFQSFEITKQAQADSKKKIANLSVFAPSPLVRKHENRALYLFYFLSFVDYFQPLTNRLRHS